MAYDQAEQDRQLAGLAHAMSVGVEFEPAGFVLMHRQFDQTIHMHRSKPVWVVHYQATQDRAEHWQGYRAVAKVPAGRDPWTVDNKRIGTERGFASLDAALAAAEAV